MAVVTQLDMARRLGVSQALVARALREDPAVAVRTRKRVQALARRLGYRPNITARALRTGRTGLVGLWIARAYGSYSARIIFALERLLRPSGYDLVITDPGPYGDPAREASRVRLAVDGVIVVDAPWQVEALARPGVPAPPCVSMGSLVSYRTDVVQVDLEYGARQALAHLRAVGRTRVAYMTPEHPLRAREPRFQAFRRAYPRGRVIRLAEPTRAAAWAALRALGRNGIGFDGLLCHNDDYALGALRGLRDLGMAVPEQVAVVGCDGVEDTDYLDCALTTIALPVERMCEQAWTFLSGRLAGTRAAPRRRILMPELVVRASTRGPGHGASGLDRSTRRGPGQV